MINLRSNKKGLTLIEILVSLAILMILFGVGLVSFRALSSQIELNGSTKKLIENLRYAQQLSVSEQVEHSVAFSTSTEPKYKIMKYESNSTTTIREIELPQEITFESISDLTNNEIRFNSYGAVKESGDVVLGNNEGETITIKVRPSGFIKKSD